MKKILLPGIAAGVTLLVAGMALSFLFNAAFPSINVEYANTSLFRPWADPLMSVFFIYPFALGIIFAWVWDKTKTLIHGTDVQRGLKFGVAAWLVATVPGMIVTYSSFQVSLLIVITWTLIGLANGVISGLIFAKLNK